MDNTVDKIVATYVEKICIDYNPKGIYLFGSYAKNNQKNNSDIDIAVVFDEMSKDEYMTVYGRLWEIAADIDGRIEPKLLVDEGDEDGFSMLQEVITTGRLVNVKIC